MGVDSSTTSSLSAASVVNPASFKSAPSSDALQLILAELKSMQGRLSSLEKSSTSNTSSVTSREAISAELTSDQNCDREHLRDYHQSRHFSGEDDDQGSIHDSSVEGLGRSKRHRSPSPAMAECKEDELDEDPSYRQFLSTVQSLLNLPTTDESTDAPSKIFSSCDRRKKKLAILPMSLPPVEEINARWKAFKNNTGGNLRSEDAEKLHSTLFNSDMILPYNRPLMKSVSKCQEFVQGNL